MSARQLAAIMFTDLVGYTALMQENEKLAVEKRNFTRRVFDECLSKYNGTLLQHYGDGTLSINTSAVNAILSAIELQTRSRQEKIALRIGIHIGEIMHDENGIYGDSVNVASRLESMAIPGSIFISDKLYDDVKNHDHIQARTLGYFELKNVKAPLQVYAITNSGIVNPSRDEVRGRVKEVSNSIAVLPFVSLSSDPENEYFCDGMTEEILNVLAKISGLQVTSRTSVFAFKNSKEDIREIAAKLNVRKILEGSVRKAGNKVRITSQLINAADGYHLWSETFDRNLEDIFEIQDEISKAIANKLRENLNMEDHERSLVQAPTQNLEAYSKYLEGLHFWNKQSAADLQKALYCFEEAVRLEPNFTTSYAHIVSLNWFLVYSGLKNPKEAIARCISAAQIAMQQDPTNPWALYAYGQNLYSLEWKWKEAKGIMDKVISLNPNMQPMHISLAWNYVLHLDFDQAIYWIKSALRLDPVNSECITTAAQIYLLAGRFDEAYEQAEYALSLEKNNLYARHMKALSTGFLGDWKKAVEMLEDIVNKEPSNTHIMVSLGIAFSYDDRKEETIKIIERIKSVQSTKGRNISYELTILYLHVDHLERFHQYFLESIKSHLTSCLIRYGTPFLKNIRDDEVMIKARKELGLPV